MNLISHKEALASGKKRFYTGKPCAHGHDSERYAISGMCVQCARERAKRRPKARAAARIREDPLREKLFAKGLGHCWYCGRELDVRTKRGTAIDHIFSTSRGGANDESNLVLSCSPCNILKNFHDLEWFRSRLAERMAGRPRFTEEQVAYLERCNLVLPPLPEYEFWFERMGLQP